ncbi:MAG: YdcF family protein [Bacteroidia bacterium]
MKNRSLSTPAFISCAVFFLCSFENPKNEIENLISEEQNEPFDAIIVPGVPYENKSLEIILKERIFWAKYLYDTKIAKNIIFSGGSVYTPFVEGEVMRIYADSLGIPHEHTFSETKAEHSTENVYYSLQIAKKLGFKKIAVATDPYQAVLIRNFIRKFCPEVKILKIIYSKIDTKNSPWPTIDASSAYTESFESLILRENKIKRFKGTMGKNIMFNAKDSSEFNQRAFAYTKIRKHF